MTFHLAKTLFGSIIYNYITFLFFLLLYEEDPVRSKRIRF